MTIMNEITPLRADMMRWRHDIHQHPEPASQLQRTVSKVAELLRRFHFDEVIENYGQQQAVIGILRKNEEQRPAIALVAALEGQPLQEENSTIKYSSVNPKCMHALGHDGEVAMLLGAAQYLTQERNFKNNVVFIFCPGESDGLGIQSMIEGGLLDRFGIQEIYNLQNYPALPAGQVAISVGPHLAALGELLVHLSAHSQCNIFSRSSCNPILAASAIIHSLDSLIATSIDSSNPLLVSMNSLMAGDNFTHIPETAELKAIVRSISPDSEKWLPAHLDYLIGKLTEAYHVQATISYRVVCPVAINQERPVKFVREIAKKLLGEAALQEYQPKLMISKDVAYFMRERPGAVIGIGNGKTAALYDPQYDFNDDVLMIGASLIVRLAEAFTVRKSHGK
ncbi:MAG: hypothetical protein A2X77_00830 [Gammaproteobacteria bacterium GWE2_42_36]|nr:MAG: hypothetical protein A2X77_00830 [Gammaproteobacteria bacterium GWE2_42_36]HCU05914.1 hypothetical protein [Coxiellaceae bacterium]